ncbi:MAG: hypothetical protein R6U32_04650 [Candidatus Woesearchaeota archaeon]
MTLDSLLEEALKIKGVFEGKRKYTRRWNSLNYFVTGGECRDSGIMKEGRYFGMGCPLPEIESLNEELEKEHQNGHMITKGQEAGFYSIRIYTDHSGEPLSLLLSDGRKTCRLTRHDGFLGTRWALDEIDYAFSGRAVLTGMRGYLYGEGHDSKQHL